MSQSLSVESRSQTGKGPARRLRMQGKIPGIFYGQGNAPVSLAVDPKTLVGALAARGENTILSLQAAGSPLDGKLALLKDYQRDPVSRKITHVDFLEVDLKKDVTVRVPIHVQGKCKGVEKGGVLDHVRHQLLVRCLPGNIPAAIDVDVTELDIGNALHVSDLKLPEGIKSMDSPQHTVVTIVAPMAEEVAPVVAAAVTAEGVPVEGAAAEGAAAPAAGAATAAGAAPAAAGKGAAPAAGGKGAAPAAAGKAPAEKKPAGKEKK